MPKGKNRPGESRAPARAPRSVLKAHGRKAPPTEPLDEEPKRSASPGMDPRSRTIVVSLMGALLFVFILIAFLAPDAAQPDGKAQGETTVWRLIFLLVPLGVMYGLLWGEKLLKAFKR